MPLLRALRLTELRGTISCHVYRHDALACHGSFGMLHNVMRCSCHAMGCGSGCGSRLASWSSSTPTMRCDVRSRRWSGREVQEETRRYTAVSCNRFRHFIIYSVPSDATGLYPMRYDVGLIRGQGSRQNSNDKSSSDRIRNSEHVIRRSSDSIGFMFGSRPFDATRITITKRNPIANDYALYGPWYTVT